MTKILPCGRKFNYRMAQIKSIMNQEDLLAECMKEAMKVEFLDTSEEIKLWAYSLYNAKIWGKSVK